MDRKIRVGAVSYLNTKPLLFGIMNSPLIQQIELTIHYPSHIAGMLLRDEIDLGLVPVAIIPQMPLHFINTQFCIGSDGPVASVCLFSDVPMEQIKRVLLDYQSRTSVQLVKLLLKEYWRLSPQLVDGGTDFRNDIKGTTAGLVIGDRALEQRKRSAYIYDLGEAWKSANGLPFVYAAWISNKEIDPGFIRDFDSANALGIDHIPSIVSTVPYEVFDLYAYYTQFISYRLDERKRAGLDLFLRKIKDL